MEDREVRVGNTINGTGGGGGCGGRGVGPAGGRRHCPPPRRHAGRAAAQGNLPCKHRWHGIIHIKPKNGVDSDVSNLGAAGLVPGQDGEVLDPHPAQDNPEHAQKCDGQS